MRKNKSRQPAKPGGQMRNDRGGVKAVNPFEKKANTPERKAQEQEEVELEQERKETLTERD
jgi:hypothetical protein